MAQSEDVPRTAGGRPDLSGTYDVATLTPLQRPERFGDKAFLTEEEAAGIARQEFERNASRNEASDPNREAPPAGGDGSPGAAGNVGGYNTFWIDRGNDAYQIDGQWRTSIIVDPPNGRQPALTDAAQERIAARRALGRPNTGTAWWMIENGHDAPGPYDDPEIRPLAERCLLGFGSTGGPPMLPVLYNNLKRIVQTDDHIMILVEMVHDARIIRMNAEHAPPEIRSWLGDSVGHWKGDTSSSTPPTSTTRRRSGRRRETSTWWSASPASTPTRCSTGSPWRIRMCGPRRGPASTSGRPAIHASTSTPATRRTTRSVAFSAGRGFSSRTCARDGSPNRPDRPVERHRTRRYTP